MQESYWGYWLILLGIFVVVVMMLIQSATTGNTQDYLMLKEVTQASMIDSIDFAYFRMYGEVKMNKEKFAENFIRRFSENVNIASNYHVAFYDLYEVPPKVTVRVSSKTGKYNVGNNKTSSFDIVNDISAILEFGYSSKDTTPGSSTKKKMCTLYMTPQFVEAMKDYLRQNGQGAKANTLKTLDDAKEAFNQEFSGYASMTWNELNSNGKYRQILTWINQGVLIEGE